MDINITEIVKYLTPSAVLVGIAYFFRDTYLPKWIESKFAVQLENHRNKLNKEFNKAVKLHDKEFEIISEAWFLLHSTYMNIADAIRPIKEHIPLRGLLPEQIKIKINTYPFYTEEIGDHVAQSDNPDDTLSLFLFRYEVMLANNSLVNCINYVDKHSVFMPNKLKMLFDKINSHLRDVRYSYEFAKEDKEIDIGELKRIRKLFKNEITSLQNEIRAQIRVYFGAETE